MRRVILTTICVASLSGRLALGQAAASSAGQPARAGETYVVDNQAANASDDNPGTQALPLRTIQAGADRAQPGDTVLVKAGIYREEVAPPRGGRSPQRPIK